MRLTITFANSGLSGVAIQFASAVRPPDVVASIGDTGTVPPPQHAQKSSRNSLRGTAVSPRQSLRRRLPSDIVYHRRKRSGPNVAEHLHGLLFQRLNFLFGPPAIGGSRRRACASAPFVHCYPKLILNLGAKSERNDESKCARIKLLRRTAITGTDAAFSRADYYPTRKGQDTFNISGTKKRAKIISGINIRYALAFVFIRGAQ